MLLSPLSRRLVVLSRPLRWSSAASINKQLVVTAAALPRLFSSANTAASALSNTPLPPPLSMMELLKDLRAKTGAPIVDCKKALQECGGSGGNNNNSADLQKAVDWLREHGAAKASSKVAGRETAEGLVGLLISEPENDTAALVKVAAETDFAGRSATFVQLVASVAEATLNNRNAHTVCGGGGGSPLLDDPIHTSNTIMEAKASNGKTVKDLLNDAIVAIRENISVPDALYLETTSRTTGSTTQNKGVWVGYVHNRVDHAVPAGTAAAVVELVPLASSEANAKTVTPETLQAVGKKLAMHIVAARPTYLTISDIPAHVLEKERMILTKQLGESHGKPAEIVEKIVQGKLRKFYESVCLTEQAHMIEEGNPKISECLADQGIMVARFEALSIS